MKHLALLLTLTAALPALAEEPKPVAARKIWDRDPHSAFTDLIRFKGKWVCTFRVGKGHVSPDGAIQVLASSDGNEWEPIARLTSKTADLRDPKLSITPKGQLMLTAAGALHQPAEHRHQTMAWFSDNAKDWGEPTPIGEPNFWLWRVTWHDGKAYAVAYRTDPQRQVRFTRLYVSEDGRKFDVLVPELFAKDSPNESTLRFVGDVGYCLTRRETGSKTAVLGTAKAPFTEWTWKDLGVRLGGPNMIRSPGDEWVVAARRYTPSVRTMIGGLDAEKGRFTERLTLPSGGDTSYAGLAWHEGKLWVSYYASHEGKTAIYLATINSTK